MRWSTIFVTLTRKNLWFICITVSFFKRCPVTITRMWTYMVIPHIRIFSDCFIQKLIICKLVLSYQLPVWHLRDGCFGSQLPICRINPLCCSYTSFPLLLNISFIPVRCYNFIIPSHYAECDKPFVEMGKYGERIEEPDHASIGQGNRLDFSIEFNEETDQLTIFDGENFEHKGLRA